MLPYFLLALLHAWIATSVPIGGSSGFGGAASYGFLLLDLVAPLIHAYAQTLQSTKSDYEASYANAVPFSLHTENDVPQWIANHVDPR